MQYHGINEFRRDGNMMDLPLYMANVAEQIEYDIYDRGIGYDLYSSDTRHNFNVCFSFRHTKAQQLLRRYRLWFAGGS